MTEENRHFYEFGDFRLDTREKILYHHDAAVPLKPKAVETLVVLIENAGNVVSKRDLMNAVWQEVFVEENNLSVNIYELRKAFARFDAAGKYIETVSRRGFRFSALVNASKPKSFALNFDFPFLFSLPFYKISYLIFIDLSIFLKK